MKPIEPNTPPNSIVWRVVHFPLTLLAIAIALIIAGSTASHLVLPSNRPGDFSGWAQVVVSAANAGIIMLAYWILVRFVERRREVADFATRGWLAELGGGFGAGIVLFSLVFVIILVLGGYRIVGTNSPSVLLLPLATSLLTGLVEETLFRGIFFRLMERLFGSWIALALSGALFGAAHLANPNATLFAGIAIALEAGIMLAALYMLTRRLWAAIGLHAAWNFAQGALYGIPVSGFQQVGLLKPAVSGSTLLTGGAFGAEASLTAVIVDTLFGVALLVLAYRRGNFVAPMWARR
ncbi:lysostaphin resistance A-like protein [Sphingomonas sp. MMS24-J45]|uniref:CPBP family intramembrane glutamic endopeptidase n=1 Tax=Sphingomonas sp. MMS24-J45 TaxID=3238806 RepID=UPI00384C65C0